MPQLQNERQALTGLLCGAVLISFSPILVKLVSHSIGPTAIGFWRMFLGGGMLLGMVVITRRRFRLTRAVFGWALLAAAFFFWDLFAWHRSVVYCGAGMATILGNTQVFATALLSALVFKEKLTGRFFSAAASGMVGVVLLVGVGSEAVEFSPTYIRGIIFGLITGVVYANYLIWTRKGIGHPSRPDRTVFVAVSAILTASILGVSSAVESAPAMPPDLKSFGYLFLLALFVQAIGWWIITVSLSLVDASRAGLILLLQPILATVWGILLFGEQLTVMQGLGALITIAAIYAGSLRKRVAAT